MLEKHPSPLGLQICCQNICAVFYNFSLSLLYLFFYFFIPNIIYNLLSFSFWIIRFFYFNWSFLHCLDLFFLLLWNFVFYLVKPNSSFRISSFNFFCYFCYSFPNFLRLILILLFFYFSSILIFFLHVCRFCYFLDWGGSIFIFLSSR